MYDKEIAEALMPEEYANLYTGIQCRDCNRASQVPFHFMGEGLSFVFLYSVTIFLKKYRTGLRTPSSVYSRRILFN